MTEWARAALIFVMSTLASAAVAVGPAAHSDHFSGGTGSQGCVGLNMADNAHHTYYYNDVVPDTAAAINWSRTYNFQGTRITTAGAGYDVLTDVIVHDRYYSDYCGVNWYNSSTRTGIAGTVNCDGLVSGSNPRCEQHSLRISNHFIDSVPTFNERRIACHENGHTLGLRHRPSSAANTSCMYDPANVAVYDDHDRAVINGNY